MQQKSKTDFHLVQSEIDKSRTVHTFKVTKHLQMEGPEIKENNAVATADMMLLHVDTAFYKVLQTQNDSVYTVYTSKQSGRLELGQ